jgi:hypothetical protein
MKDEWIKMGSVGVDSGQLMICDPCYLNMWEDNEYEDFRTYKDKETGKIYQLWKDFEDFEHKLPEYDNKTPNILIKEKKWEKILYEPEYGFNYNYISHREGMYKQIRYLAGHDGLAVVFNSGLGDGRYGVWGRIRDVPGWGKRITEVLIKLVDDVEAQKILEYWNKTFFKEESE